MNEEFVIDTTGDETEASSSSKSYGEPKNTLLDQLRTIIEAEVVKPSIEILLPDRPGVSVVFSPNVDQQRLSAWRRQAGEGSKKGMDFLKFAGIVVAQTTEAILFNGEEVQDEDGNNLTFGSSVILDMVDEDRPWPGVKKFWGSDPHLQATALKVLDAAGWGEDAELAEDDEETPLA